ncbi:MAG: class II aldolase/adducin family protein [Anaerolineaceae bacterium]|nr:MAG: class II aldolase/adducin family protein [Anaerolineaceae bacterium]
MAPYREEKQRVTEICRILLERGYLKATEGNVSVRVQGQPSFVITPSNYDYALMQVDDICVVDFDLTQQEGERKPSIESAMHAAVYQERPDVHAIIHTHQPYASALGIMNKPIPHLFDEQVRFLGRLVEIIPYAPSGTGLLKKNVRKKIGTGNNAFILQNHGVLILGVDDQRAIHNMALLEKCALVYLLAILTDEKVTRIPLAVREIAFAKLRADEKKFSQLDL